MRLLMLAVLASAAALAGCGGGSGDAADLELVVPDNNIRTEGVECSGARPFQHVRRGTAFRIEDGEGETVADGRLPAGRARNADPSIDWGVERIPTVCVFDLAVELPERERYRFLIEGSVPIEFRGELVRDQEEPLQLVLSG